MIIERRYADLRLRQHAGRPRNCIEPQIDKPHRPHLRPRRHREVRMLPRTQREREGVVGQTIVQTRPAIALDAARKIDRDRVGMLRRERGKQGKKISRQSPRQPATEKTIDEDVTGNIRRARNALAAI